MRHKQIISKLVSEVRLHGMGRTLAKTVRHIGFLARGGARSKDPFHERRVELCADLSERFNSTVRYGPFRGMRLTKEASWIGPDRAPMLLGMYEQEVVQVLSDHRDTSRAFIDIGAADGFYGVGVLVAGWFSRAYCYELSEVGQTVMRRNAAVNGVSKDLIVRGVAHRDFYNDIPREDLEGAVILVDIEGGEFDLLDASALTALQAATVVIEIHPWVEDGEGKIQRLLERAQSTHRVSSFATGARNPGEFEELRKYSDTDRWLICSEDRPMLMSWMLLEPK